MRNHKTYMNKLTSLTLPILALLCSCENDADNYRYPSVITDYTCLTIDAHGEPKQLRLDNGLAYPIAFTDEYYEAYGQLPTYHCMMARSYIRIQHICKAAGCLVAT